MTTNNVIAQAVEPLKSQAIAQAVAFATKQAQAMLKRLEEAAWDANVVNPMDRAHNSREAYQTYQRLRELINNCTSNNNPAYRNRRDPDLRKPCQESLNHWLAEVAKDAGVDFDAYVYKLNEKTGAVVTAELIGDSVWYDSILSVAKADGTIENWNTKIIVNVSKYGKVFNQYPTRLMKPAKVKAAKPAVVVVEEVQVEQPKKAGFDRKAYMKAYNARKNAAK